MTDQEAINHLCDKLGTQIAVAEALNVHPQVITNWRARGIRSDMRYDVWDLLAKHGKTLPVAWIKSKKVA